MNIFWSFSVFRPREKRADDSTIQLQKFIFEDQRLVCTANFDLCVGVRETDGGRGEVVLVKRRPDDVMQCFVIQKNGYALSTTYTLFMVCELSL